MPVLIASDAGKEQKFVQSDQVFEEEQDEPDGAAGSRNPQ